MAVDRRQFLSGVTLTAAGLKFLPETWALAAENAGKPGEAGGKAYGSGHFGNWIEDEFGLPAFHYTCDQINDPKAVTQVNPGHLSATEHIHQVGNDRVVAIASNYGHVRVRQDEGAPKFLNAYAPERGQFAGGFGYLTDGKTVGSQCYRRSEKRFERIFGIGYLRKKVATEGYAIDQVVFAPFGDDPVLVSQVTITNHGSSETNLRWIEYWGCQQYQFSFRGFMQGFAGKSMHELRRDFATRFEHHFKKLDDGSGLVETEEFLGRDPVDERQFQGMVSYLEKNPNSFLTAPDKNAPKSADFDDLNPLPTFLVSLDAPADGTTTNGKDFFGSGGVNKPSGLEHKLDGDLSKTGPESALLLERKFTLKPGESRTLTFLYGYLPSGFDLDSLATKYRRSAKTALADSSHQWKKTGLPFTTDTNPSLRAKSPWN